MARTIDEIKAEIQLKISETPQLSALTGVSQASVWRLITYVAALAWFNLETMFDRFRAEVETRIGERQPGTAAWYIQKIKEFQPGDAIDPATMKYPVIDESKRIVSAASYKKVEPGDDTPLLVALFKVAKGESGSLEPLNSQEQSQLRNYIAAVGQVGVNTQVVSLNGDKLRITAEVFFDGINEPETVQTNVEAALNSYMRNLGFDGTVMLSKIVDSIQSVPGVVDVVIDSAVAIVVGEENTTINRIYECVAGWCQEDDSEGYTFADTITYTPVNI